MPHRKCSSADLQGSMLNNGATYVDKMAKVIEMALSNRFGKVPRVLQVLLCTCSCTYDVTCNARAYAC